MNKILFIAIMAVTALGSCGNANGNKIAGSGNQVNDDSTLCQFNNIKVDKQFSYCEEEDTTYFDNRFTALWPVIINGKPCYELQQALFRAMTDSAELNQLDKVVGYLLNPASYTDCDTKRLSPVKAVKDDENKLSTSEVNVTMQDMTDRLLTYRLSTYSYMAGGAHGIYANNFVTYDLQREKAVVLDDIIADTTLLRTATLKSIKQTYDCSTDDLFIPDNGLLPLPRDFYIQDHVLHVVYQVYEIASYAQGAFDAPIYPYMLKPEEMKSLFTPYGLQLINYDL